METKKDTINLSKSKNEEFVRFSINNNNYQINSLDPDQIEIDINQTIKEFPYKNNDKIITKIQCNTINKIDLSNCNLYKVPEQVFEIEADKIFVLKLSHNQLHAIPLDISRFTNLTDFDISYNNLSYIPNEIKNCVSLRNVRLDHNKLNELTRAIKHLPIQVLTLANNNIKIIPLWLYYAQFRGRIRVDMFIKA